jgi:hypothetical protein
LALGRQVQPPPAVILQEERSRVAIRPWRTNGSANLSMRIQLLVMA